MEPHTHTDTHTLDTRLKPWESCGFNRKWLRRITQVFFSRCPLTAQTFKLKTDVDSTLLLSLHSDGWIICFEPRVVNFMPSERPLEGGAGRQTNLEHICEQTATACCCFLDKSHCGFFWGGNVTETLPPSICEMKTCPAVAPFASLRRIISLQFAKKCWGPKRRLIHKEPETSTNQKLGEHRRESKNTRAENTRRNISNTQEADQGQVNPIRTITREGNKEKTGSNTTWHLRTNRRNQN